jgi:phenylpyruvate tautomerase PptA (4-oxalocrotonate tautomerase family)
MPFINAKTNTALTAEKEAVLKTKLADAMSASFPGKTENWLMIQFESGCSMYFAGSDAPCMMVHMDIFGSQSDKAYDKMTAAVCDLISKECGIPADRIYVKYTEVEHWGWNGGNF